MFLLRQASSCWCQQQRSITTLTKLTNKKKTILEVIKIS
jgi:hypothetical protein